MSRLQLLIDKTWTLFLDRDGVINVKFDNDYVKRTEEFLFIEGIPSAIGKLNNLFGKTVVVTNQQGIAKGLMSENDLLRIHEKMLKDLKSAGAHIDDVYFCPDLATSGSLFRKPNIGMALAAKKTHPEINFKKSVMVGDSLTDMQFGKRLKMTTVYISNDKKLMVKNHRLIDYRFLSLNEFADFLIL